MSYFGKDYAFPETVAAVDTGANIVRTIRASVGYSMEELALTCGLAVSEIADLEATTTPTRSSSVALPPPCDCRKTPCFDSRPKGVGDALVAQIG